VVRRKVRVSLRHSGRFVPEQLTDYVKVNTLHDKPVCGGVAQRVE
jgi:hypothetical protein